MNYLNREFSKKKNWMAKKHIQRSLTLLLIRKKCKFKPQGDTISIKKKKTTITSIGKDVETLALVHCWWRCELVWLL